MPNDKFAVVGTNIAEKATMIWNVADMLRGPFKPHEYGLVILPMTVVKRFHDCLLPTHDAVLETYPQIDRARVCETGGSYGGFMTNWIIGHTDRFCACASQRSISNWLSFCGVSDIGSYFAPDQTAGDLYDDPAALWAQSPLKYAKNVKTPTLFIHSDEDYRCPLEQGLQMFASLVDRGVETRLCLFHGENHELSRSGKPKHRLRRLEEITDWFEKHAK